MALHLASLFEERIGQQPFFLAFSSGPDSVCLLQQLMRVYSAEQVILVHFNHQLQSKSEQQRALSLAKFYSDHYALRLITRRLPVQVYANRKGVSVELAARHLRYRLLSHLARLNGVSAVFLGHHLDDACETMIMNLIRGSGSGMKGLLSQREMAHGLTLFRPLLSCSKADILAELDRLDMGYWQDPSNLVTDVTRNQIRHQVMPRLAEIQPSYLSAMQRFMGTYAKMSMYMDQQSQVLLDCIQYDPDFVAIDSSLLSQEPEALRGHAICLILPLALSHLFPHQDKRFIREPLNFSFQHISQIEKFLCHEGDFGPLDLPHQIRVSQKKGRLIIQRRESLVPSLTFSYSRSTFPSCIQLDELGLICELSVLTEWPQDLLSTESQAFLALDCSAPLMLECRSWQPGDRFIPFGMTGSKKVSRYLMDRQVAGHERRRIPLFFVNNDLAWILGQQISEPFRVKATTRWVLRIQVQNQIGDCL
ncbi:MAG: tRNA lysidine(34) synthetase TilS [Actinobacteria bacterium]|nr:tRNA lysidine(34) synthetase TilS [Actinomycetota bacterium]